MGEFEDFIKAKYPVDYESLKEKYPNVPIVEFYGDEQDVWDFQQSKIEQLEKELKQKNRRIHDLEFYTSQFLYLLSEHQDSPVHEQLPEAQKHLRKLVDGFDLKESLRGGCE